MNDVKSLMKSFVYALKGIKWALCHERNFRIHITCMCYMFYFLLRYDFFVISKTEICLLLLSCALVLGGELINTGIEKADDTTLSKFDEIIEPIFNAMLNAERENAHLANIRNLLMLKLMSGELDVSKVEI